MRFIGLLLLFGSVANAASYTRFDDVITRNSISVGSTGAANSKSVIDMTSTTKGFLPPRMTTTQRDAISSPPAGLEIFNTSTSAPNFYTGSAWSQSAGTVTSVAATVPSVLSVSGSPITSSGTLAFTYSGTALPVANGGTAGTTKLTAASGLFTSITRQAFNTGGSTGTVTIGSGALWIEVYMSGGGGGGGSSGTANGTTAAQSGGTTTFSVHSGSALATATGGGGGGSVSSNVGGAGGTCTLAAGPLDIGSRSGSGGGAGGFSVLATVYLAGGQGGVNQWGGAGAGTGGAGNVGFANSGAGGGGAADNGGAANSASGSGGGAGGFCHFIINSPSASYDYGIGDGGNGAVPHASGTAGGNGATSAVVLVEHYN